MNHDMMSELQVVVTCYMGSHSIYYLPPDTGEHTPPNPTQKGWYSRNLPRRDGRL